MMGLYGVHSHGGDLSGHEAGHLLHGNGEGLPMPHQHGNQYIFSKEGRPATLHSISRNLKRKDPHRKVDKARSHGLQKPEPSTIG